MNSSQIRQEFLDYFAKQNHQEVASSSLVPGNDATLLFTNAGMVQFKELFLGQEQRPYSKAVTSQRCVRAGGKHNDLENVGYTARHHTFFEMLGNFSFGDYFKEEAIKYAWDFLVNVLGLPKSRLWVSVYKDDDEAFEIWNKVIGVSEDRISRCGDEDNFWSMGDTGPCGPCTEIFYDHGPEIPGGPPGSPDADGDRYIEIWNMVFMQFNRDKKGVMHKLPKPSVDTGMGLERITAVVQGVHNNYEIDSFQKLIQAIMQLQDNIDENHPSLKVIADHIRSCSFLIADGVIPSNEGRGYVLRRIIRRAIRHGHKLGLPMPFFHRLVAPLVAVMGDAYPLIVDQQKQIERTLLQEEEQFERTIDQGLKLLQDKILKLDAKSTLSGDVAFKLYDTYGFPLDLTCDIAREQNLIVDIAEFDKLMQEQRQKSQSSSQFQADEALQLSADTITNFHGYESDNVKSKVLAIFVGDKSVDETNSGDIATIVLQDTPFYAESGGQIGDTGTLFTDDFTFRVDDTQKQGQSILHHGEVINGSLKAGDDVRAEIESLRREQVRLNHTATHLLHAALKEIIGSHVNQKGSLVNQERSRFDFSHTTAVSLQELRAVEVLVNDKIRANYSVDTKVMSIDEAKLDGAVALFGEKYGDEVRVLSMGDFSKELCGGTHARRTGDIGLFKIITEYGIASGVRRIEFVTGAYALTWLNEELDKLYEVSVRLKTQPNNILDKISQNINSLKAKDKEILKLQQSSMLQSGNNILNDGTLLGDVTLLVKRLDDLDAQGLRAMLDQVKSSSDKAVIVLYAISGDKISVVAGVSKSILGQVPAASLLVKQLCGRGGGRDDMAQGGGVVPADLDLRIGKITEMVRG
ncbi:MAG: alanine--tRNA ligase [Legionellaceae bacterium]|nr:alanine--tRNA ligase [Legionellaceae bacterium]